MNTIINTRRAKVPIEIGRDDFVFNVAWCKSSCRSLYPREKGLYKFNNLLFQGAPANVSLYAMGQFTTPVAQKAFYRADTVQYFWNAVGTNLLVFTHTDVDKTGQSYYGETNLYYLAVSGNFDCRIDLGMFLQYSHFRQSGSYPRCRMESQWPRVCRRLWNDAFSNDAL